MNDLPSEPVHPGRRREAGRRIALRALLGLAIVATVLAGVAAVLYANRRAVAQQLLVAWLERRGIEAEAAVERIELDGFVGRIRLGDAADPQLSIERIEAGYAVSPPWSATGFGVTLGRVRLLRPVLRASWRDGKFSLGPLDALIQQFTGGPAPAAAGGPAVLVEAGQLHLDTPQGRLQLLGDARLEGGRLMQLAVRMPVAARMGDGGIEARGLGGTLQLVTTGDRVAVRLQAVAERVSSPSARGEDARLTLAVELPYPDLAARRADGRVTLQADLGAAGLQAGAGRMREVRTHAAFNGQVAGGMEALRFTGEGAVDLAAMAADGPGFTVQQLHAALAGVRLGLDRDEHLDWNLKSTATVAAGRFEYGELLLQQVRATLANLEGEAGDGVTRIGADGSLQAASGSWPLLGAPAADDMPELAAMKRALQAFSIHAPGLRLAAGSAGTTLQLTRAARVSPANGGVLRFAPLARPVYQAGPGQLGAGALSVAATRGRGLPEARIVIPEWRLTEKGFEAELDGRAALDFAPAQGIRIGSRGRLALAGDALSYIARDCVDLAVGRLELDGNDVAGMAGALCPDGAPLLVAVDGTWRMRGSFRGVSAEAPFAAMRFSGFEGKVAAEGSSRGTGLDIAVTSGQAADTTQPARFNPLTASGSAALQGERWTGTLALASGGQRIGRMTLAHDAAARSGGVHIEVPELALTEGGLQPAALSALAAGYVQSPATGSIRFDGRIDWTAEATTSSGRLVIPGLDFTSPAGAVKGLKGEIEFTSLTPLVTAPDQSLRVDQLVTATEVTGLNLVFALDTASLRVAEGEVSAAGGRLRAAPFAVPLDLAQPFSGMIALDRVQLGQVIADAGLGDRVTLDAVVSGRLPFVWTPGQGVRIVGGTLAAVQPGRVTIRREVLAEVQASGGEQVPPGLVEDLAYQAMENLAFDTLSVDVNSLDEGRIGLVFRVKGRHDPPQRQQLRVGLAELISRRFLERNLPLPSDTGIDLTLDTTLNLNQLISDLLAVNRARRGGAGTPAVPASP